MERDDWQLVRVGLLIMAALIAALVAYCNYPSVRDLRVYGRVADQYGRPVSGLHVLIGDLKHGFPKDYFGQHAVVQTDADGHYAFTLETIHMALWIEITDYNKHGPCPGGFGDDLALPAVDPRLFHGAHDFRRDLVFCVRTDNNHS